MDQDFIKLLLGETCDPNLLLPDPSLVRYYEDFKNRVIWIDDEIDGTTLDVVSKIIHWNREDKALSIKDRAPIRIFFHSTGGDLNVEEILVSIIKLSKTPIYGIALGMVASAASLIYLSCHKRYALPNAVFVFHRGSCSNMGGNYNEIQAAMEDYRIQIEKMEKFYIENTSFPEEVIKEKIKSDWYIYCEEGLKYNIITDLVDNIDLLL